MVIGGGLAGIAAACSLADRGVPVTLLEKRPYLGGRAFSFPDAETGRHIDNGQHIYLGCCTAYTGLLQRLGVFDRTTLQPRMRAVVVNRNGKRGELNAAPLLPSPLHLLPSFLTYPHLSLREKLRAATAMLSIMRTDRAKRRDALEAESFRDWLVRHGQSERAIAALWDLLTLPVFNDTVDAVSAYMGLMFFQDGMLAGRHSADIGISRVGLTELVGDAARRYIEDRGGQVLTGQNVTGIEMEDGAVTGVTAGGDFIPADAVVTAVPWDALPRLLPPDIASDANVAAAETLEWAPIINVHVWYDRPIIDEPFLAVLDSPLQWVFNRTHIQGSSGARTAPVHLSQRRVGVRVHGTGRPARALPQRDGSGLSRSRGGHRRALPRGEAGECHLPLHAGGAVAAAVAKNAHSRAHPGRRLDADGMARHHGVGGAQWPARRGGSRRRSGTPPNLVPRSLTRQMAA